MPVLAVAYLATFTILRIVLYLRHGADAAVAATSLPALLLAGFVNDAVQALYLLAPVALVVALLPDRGYRARGVRVAVHGLVALVIASLLFLAAAESFFFDEFDARFNIVAVDYLLYPTEVVGDIRAEYPVGPVLALALALGALATWSARAALRASFAAPSRAGARLAVLGAWLAAVALAAVAWPTDGLSWSSNRVANELAQNGHSSFFRALRTSEIDYHAYYATRPPAENVARLTKELAGSGGRFVDLGEGRFDREFPARPEGLGRLNVVVVASESFGAEFSRLHGSERDWTPNFDRYARQGLWFANAYASGTRTVRGLEALTASIPPIPTVSILRRPGSEHITTWGSVMRGLGYHAAFLYGGYGYFDNMKHFYGSNDFEVLDREAIPNPRFANVWGAADEDLFDLALDRFDRWHAEHRPFFTILMTTSNHKPYTFRTGLERFGIRAQGGGRESGVRYADYALGCFLDEARKHPWFDDTVFVVVADHGARVYGRQDIPLKTYEIPLTVYAPKHLAPRTVEALTGQIDVAPTVMGLLGLPYRAPFFGRDVLAHPEAARVAVFNHNHDVALLRDGRMVVLGLNRRVESFDYDRARDAYAPAPPDPELEALAVAYYQTAYELFRAHRW